MLMLRALLQGCYIGPVPSVLTVFVALLDMVYFWQSVMCSIEREVNHMATFEERLAAIEHEHEELKQKIELQTIAIGALVNKAALERLNEKYDKLFEALAAHDTFINHQLAELREKVEVDVEGKIAGLQTGVRQGFEAMNARFETVATKDDLKAMNVRFDQIMLALAALAPKPDQKA